MDEIRRGLESTFITGAIISSLLGTGLYLGVRSNNRDIKDNFNLVPRVSTVQEGYVAPSKLEVTLEDLDKNGQQETVVTIDGVKYRLQYDLQHKPTFTRYETKTAEENVEEK